jgi:2-polyprenyl-3-methyl-5-hydroxy-6-metoxy-1,4-benzoquinol methylase
MIKNKNEISKIIKKLKNIIFNIQKDKIIFFTDFKIGVDHNNEGVHWSIQEIRNGKKVLDIACNDGTLLDYFLEKGFNTYGIDPAYNIVNNIKKHNI